MKYNPVWEKKMAKLLATANEHLWYEVPADLTGSLYILIGFSPQSGLLCQMRPVNLKKHCAGNTGHNLLNC
jgi:hypothetical protein